MNKGSLPPPPLGILGFARLSCCLLALFVSTTSSSDGSVVWFDGNGAGVDSANDDRDIGNIIKIPS